MSDDKVLMDEQEEPPLMVRVTAPSTLPAGYTFEALLNDDPDRPFSCEVPEGGINEGESFLTPVPNDHQVRRIVAPSGKWKDGLCDCFNLGIFHPHLWCAFCCSRIAMGQVMTRMHLTWLGEPGPRVATQNTFKVVVILYLSYIVYSVALAFATADYTMYTVPTGLTVMKWLGNILFVVWTVYSLVRTRQSIREQYSIPERQCVGCEDLCCSLFCTCCTVAQMARHTGEYETYPGVCLSETGLPKEAPYTV
eukprot:Nitzschia sp. Nitz4//scaffold1_size375055//18726//19561//NITZ4_000208-RA/size375055-processed-gene-0.285-mRNA-1//1//CDS//3329540841//8572//frame0